MGNRKLRQVDFKELWDYVESRSEDYGDFTKYLKALVQADKDKQDGQEQKLGKKYSRTIERIRQLDESRLEILDSFLGLMDEIKSNQKKRARKPKKGTQD